MKSNERGEKGNYRGRLIFNTYKEKEKDIYIYMRNA